MIRRKYANMRIYEDNIDFADVENTVTYSLSAKNLENNLNKREEELCNKISDLESKLVESEKERELDNSFWKQECDSLQKTLVEKDKENNELEFIVEEIEQFAWEQLNNDNFDKYKAYDEMYTKIKQLTKNSPYEKQHQDKISFTIEQLEKVKEFFLEEHRDEEMDTDYLITKDAGEIADFLLYQIKQLKEGK